MTDLGEPFADGDDPEDAWDSSDPLVLSFDNIVIRVRLMLQGATGERAARGRRLLEDLATIRRRIISRRD